MLISIQLQTLELGMMKMCLQMHPPLVGEHVMVAVAAAEHLTCLMPVPGDFLLKIDPLGGSSLLLCPPKSMTTAHAQAIFYS